MSMRELEAQILAELKQVAKNTKIRQKDIMEWSTGKIEVHEGETFFYLPDAKVNVCVKLPAKKAAQQSVQADAANAFCKCVDPHFDLVESCSVCGKSPRR